jgi:hypothetical protein
MWIVGEGTPQGTNRMSESACHRVVNKCGRTMPRTWHILNRVGANYPKATNANRPATAMATPTSKTLMAICHLFK